MLEMRYNGATHGFVLVVREIEFSGCILNDLRDLVVMHMAYVRENVVLYLMIQPACKPVH